MSDRNDGDDRKRGRGAGKSGDGAGRSGPRGQGGNFKRDGGGAKPFRSRPPRREDGEGGERRPYRPREEFGERGERPQRAGGFKRNESGEGKSFGAHRFDGNKRSDDGEKKSFRPRSPRGSDSEGAERRFDRPRKPHSEGSDRPPRGDRPARPHREDGHNRGGAERRSDRAPRRDAVAAEPEGGMRIAKRLARAGIASRRDAEAMIADGRVRLNGHLVETPATIVQSSDRIEIDGEALPATERTRLWLYHKPAGLVTTNRDPEGRPTVFDRLPEDLPRVLTVGRLDINTEGLLLLTNDGGLSRALELPSTGWLRRYRVRAHGAVSQAQLDELKHGIAIDGVFYGAIEAVLDSEKGANVWMTLGLREGKNREVKRILGHLGLEVNRLIRISFGPFQLGELPEGAVREIRGRTLRDQLGPTLIEESGADFDAPIVNPFTNEVVEAGTKPRKPEASEEGEERPQRPERSEWVTARGDSKPAKGGNRKEFGREKRESALSRLDTKPDRGPRRERDGQAPRGTFRPGGGGAKRFNRDEAPEDKPARPKPGGRRNANVWIAPGGRPLGEQAAARRREREESGETGGAKPFRSRGFRDAPNGATREGGADKPRRSAGFRSQKEGQSFGEGGDRPRGPRKDGGGRPFGGGGKPGGRSGAPGGGRGSKGA